ncbi:hypothetical protein [Paenibacillus harenae]|nr:hypothetical protein [Paenibacillus harenae]MDQ0062336.1 hypothetical protein [Paenibacillus harenae]
MLHRIVERPHPVTIVRNPNHPEYWYTEQQKRFDSYLRGAMK